jgi:hypothetical protein
VQFVICLPKNFKKESGSLRTQLEKLEADYRKLRGQVEESRAGIKG